MANALQFFRGTLNKIKAHAIQNGAMYLDKDTNCLYIDNESKHNAINAQGLYSDTYKVHPTGSYYYTFSSPTAVVDEANKKYSYLTCPPEGLKCGGLDEKGYFSNFIPPVIIPTAENTDYDYVISADVIDRADGPSADPDHIPVWIIDFVIQLPENRTSVEPFSVIILDSK